MRYTVTCEICGHVIASGFGECATWTTPHPICSAERVTVRWEGPLVYSKTLGRLS